MGTSRLTRPIDSLEEQVAQLDAAIVICRAAPKKGGVHNLRTATRRVEAQLTLLELLRPMVQDANQDEVRKRLKKVRRAAGKVRDLDVQITLIQGDAPAKAEGHTSSGDHIRREAKQLRKHLKEKRQDEAIKLRHVLRGEEQKLALALRNLQDALKPAKDHAESATQLAMHIKTWFRANVVGHSASSASAPSKKDSHAESMRSIEMLDEVALHKLRKGAKLCRYMAESLPSNSVAARQLASQFETIQEAGGHWHDWLLLKRVAAKYQGGHSDLAERYAEHRGAALADYRLRLEDVLPGIASARFARPESSRLPTG